MRFVCLGLLAIAWVVESSTLTPHFADRLVYIGTYTGRQGLPSKGIYAFRFDDTSGALTPVGLVAETPSPSFLIASSNGRFVFAVNELQSFGGEASGSATSFTVDPATSKLAEISVQPTRGAGPCHLTLDRTGRYLAVANYGGGNYALLPVGVDGRLQPPMNVVAGVRPENAAAKPLGHMVAFDAENRFLVAADKGLNRMLIFRFDALMGQLTPNEPPSAPLPPGSGPRHFAFHPNGRWLFTINEQGRDDHDFFVGCEGREPAADIQRSDETGNRHDRLHRRDCRASDRQLRLRIQSLLLQHCGLLSRGQRRADAR